MQSQFPAYFRVDVSETPPGCHIARLSGELDAASATTLHDLLVEMAGSTVVVDLSAVEFIDSRGVGELIRARRDVIRAGHDLVFHGPLTSPVRRTLAIMGLLELIDLDVEPGEES